MKNQIQRNILFYFLLFIFYIVLTIIFTYPLLFHFTTHIPSFDADSTQYIWNEWWMKKSLVDLKQNPFYTHYIYYPFGTGLIYNAFTPLHGVFSIPFQLLFGLTTAHNIVLILSLIAAAFGTFFLCYELCRDKKYSIIGSILFAFSPFVMERIQMHINLSDVFPIVWFVLFFVKAHKKPLLNFILFSSVFLFFIFLTDYYYLFYTLLFIGIYIIFFRTRALFFTTCKILTIFLIVTSPFLIMFIHDYQNLNFYEIYQDARALSPDLFRFVIPSWQNQHLLRWYELIYNKVGRNIDGETYYFGLIPLGFLIFSVIKLFRKNIWIKFFTFVFFIFFIFALGPTLKIGGENTNLLLPFSLLQQTPMLRELRVSGRFIIYCYLALAVIVSITLKKLLYKSQVLWKRIGILFVFLVVLIEYWPGTIQLEKFEDYPVYQTIKDDKDNFSVLEIPIPFWSDYNRIMYFQTIHEKPIIGGMVSRVPKSIVELYHQDALLDNIVFLEFQDSTKNEIRISKDSMERSLQKFNIKYILLHYSGLKANMNKAGIEEFDRILQNLLSLEMIYHSSELSAYRYHQY